jgi:regulator of cell morphogenesis and NO signaling
MAQSKNHPELIKASLEKLYREHEDIGDAVHEIRRLANDYAIPEDACNTFTLTYRKLKAFEDDLHRHVHLENNILFLKADQILTDGAFAPIRKHYK